MNQKMILQKHHFLKQFKIKLLKFMHKLHIPSCYVTE